MDDAGQSRPVLLSDRSETSIYTGVLREVTFGKVYGSLPRTFHVQTDYRVLRCQSVSKLRPDEAGTSCDQNNGFVFRVIVHSESSLSNAAAPCSSISTLQGA